MTVEELAGRVLAVETIAMMALGMYIANSKNDPDYQKAASLIEHLRHAIAQHSASLPPAGAAEAKRHGKHLLDVVSANLRNLRGEGGQLN